MEQVPDAEVVIVPVGGSGITGRGFARNQNVAAGGQDRRRRSRKCGQLFGSAGGGKTRPALPCIPPWRTASPFRRWARNAFQIARPLVDKIVTVTEEQIAIAILRILELEKGVVEGAAATPLAACLSGKLKRIRRQEMRSSSLRRKHRSQRAQPRDRARSGRGRPAGAFRRRDQRSPRRSGGSDHANRLHWCQY